MQFLFLQQGVYRHIKLYSVQVTISYRCHHFILFRILSICSGTKLGPSHIHSITACGYKALHRSCRSKDLRHSYSAFCSILHHPVLHTLRKKGLLCIDPVPLQLSLYLLPSFLATAARRFPGRLFLADCCCYLLPDFFRTFGLLSNIVCLFHCYRRFCIL